MIRKIWRVVAALGVTGCTSIPKYVDLHQDLGPCSTQAGIEVINGHAMACVISDAEVARRLTVHFNRSTGYGGITGDTGDFWVRPGESCADMPPQYAPDAVNACERWGTR